MIAATPLRRRVLIAAVLAAVAASTEVAFASDAAATMSVSVTVARKCAIQTRALTDASAAVQLACSKGHVSGVQLGDRNVAFSGELRQVTRIQPSTATEASVVLVNF